MNTFKKVMLLALVAVFLMAAVPPWVKPAQIVPCYYMWQYAMGYSVPPSHFILPDDVYPGSPLLCIRSSQLPQQYL